MLDKTLAAIAKYRTEKEERKKLNIERKMLIDKREYELKLKKLDLEEKYVESGNIFPDKIDQMSMEQMEKSWKDEFIMLILFAPIVLAFIPGAQEFTEIGFKLLSACTPDWYVYMLMGIVTVTYGLRSILKVMFTHKSKEPKIHIIKPNNVEANK